MDALTVFMTIQSKNIMALIGSIATGMGIVEDPAFDRIGHDLRKTIHLADQVSKIKMQHRGDVILSRGR